jgi:CRISPR-associated protein Cas1
MKHNINTIFVNKNGKYGGKLEFSANKNIFLKKRQYKLSDTENTRLPLAKSIVKAKIRNELSFVQRIKRTRNNEEDFGRVIASLKTALEKVDACENSDVLRGHEGIAAKNYFSVLRYNLIPEWARFPRRSMHPPLSNVNAVLSFLYTLLMYRVEAAIEAVGLDPMPGFLHVAEYGKNALVFDLMEEFRTPVADTICCSLFNLNILAENDFDPADEDIPEAGTDRAYQEIPVFLAHEGIKKVISIFEKKIESTSYYQPLNAKTALNTIILEQVKCFKRVILGEETEYQGYKFK